MHERFRSDRDSVEDDERSGRPSTAKTDENCDVIFLVNPAPGRSDCVLVVSVEVYDYFFLYSDFLFWLRLRSRCVTPLPRSRFVSLRLPHINISNIRI